MNEDFPPIRGDVPSIEWLPCEALHVDPKYQREVDTRQSTRLIQKIASDFDWRLCAPLTVSKRKDRDGAMCFWVIDGQHRLRAAELRKDIPELPCIVSTFESFEEEALAFVAVNSVRKQVTPLDKFHARLAAGEQEANELLDHVEHFGLTIARSNDAAKWKPGEISFPDQISAQMKKGDEGVEAATFALQALAKAFPDVALLRGSDLFGGLCAMHRTYDIPEAEIAKVPALLRLCRQAQWIVRADNHRAQYGGSRHKALGSVLFGELAVTEPDPKPTISKRETVERVVQTAPKPVNDQPAPKVRPDGKRWCDQCEALVSARHANACISAFCKGKVRT